MAKTELKTLVKNVTQELNDLEKKQVELRKELKAAGKTALAALKEIIRTSDYIEGVRWTQYTPYFNDGDTCEFGVHEMQFKFSDELSGRGDKTGKKEDDNYDEDGDGFIYFWGDKDIKKYFDNRKDVLNFKDLDDVEEVVETLKNIHKRLTGMEETLLEAFGDHIQVTVTREGVETEEHEHE